MGFHDIIILSDETEEFLIRRSKYGNCPMTGLSKRLSDHKVQTNVRDKIPTGGGVPLL